ncbi:MAG: ParA family protein [Eubacterium sp.]|nr:ParA family protein [Eubacterium sp.]
MKIISIINLKGGVAKTLSAVNIAHILATEHNKRVLLIDNDKQGNVSKMFGVHNYNATTIADILTQRKTALSALFDSGYEDLIIIPANMNLLKANLEVMLDTVRPQQTRLRAALKPLYNDFDYCVIDCAPDINISTINALVASDYVLVPIKIDNFAFDGLAELKEQIENVREDFNPDIKFYCFVTCYQNNEVNRQGEEWLKERRDDYPLLSTHIRRTVKIDESTFASKPILVYSKRCGASKDYLALAEEILSVSDSDTNGR